MSDPLYELAELLLAAAKDPESVPTPWRAPTAPTDAGGCAPLEHEGCAVWPWRSEADMRLAYWLRNHVVTIVAALVAQGRRP